MKNFMTGQLQKLSFRYFKSLFHQDIDFARSVMSLSSTAAYIEEHMAEVPSVDTLFKVHDVALNHIALPKGMVLEFGVFSGKSINYLASRLQNTTIYGFDSFEGLPEFWRDGFDKGAFAVAELPKVASNVKFVKGWFNETLPHFPLTDNIAYLHVDCDLYSSTKTIFEHLKDRIVTGTVIVFDEYFNYPGWKQGEFKAFREFLEETGKTYRYLAYNRRHEQVAVIIT